VGNLPFRRIVKTLGCDVTCGEMAMALNIVQGQSSEWALLRRHKDEDLFGVQIAGGHPDQLAMAAELIDRECEVDFIDINMGCPIDLVCNKGAGSALMQPSKRGRLRQIVQTVSKVISCPLTIKLRTGYFEKQLKTHEFLPHLKEWGVAACTLHGRTRQQRYSKPADWDYIHMAAKECSVPILGNGDIYDFMDYEHAMSVRKAAAEKDDLKEVEEASAASEEPVLASVMLGRGALVKPWVFTEIKERRRWDISATERLELLKKYVRFGLEHWGADDKGLATTRRFLLELLSFLCRYIPVGLLHEEGGPPRINWRPPRYQGRCELETLMASTALEDWVELTIRAGLPPPKEDFKFNPKHKSNAHSNKEAAAPVEDELEAQG